MYVYATCSSVSRFSSKSSDMISRGNLLKRHWLGCKITFIISAKDAEIAYLFSVHVAGVTMLRCSIYRSKAIFVSPCSIVHSIEIHVDGNNEGSPIHYKRIHCHAMSIFIHFLIHIHQVLQVTTSFVCSVYSLLSHSFPYYLTYYTIFL